VILAQIRDALAKPAYDVCELYKTEGFAQWLARKQEFEMVTLAVITFNAFWLAIDADYNTEPDPSKTPLLFWVMDNVFCAYFTFEWLVRFSAFKRKLEGFTDGWFIFDSVLCGLMVFETWILSIILFASPADSNSIDVSFLRVLRLLRLARTGRVAKVLHALPEMLIMIRGIAAATRSVFFMLVLLGICLYIYAITFRQLTAGLDMVHSDVYFESIPTAVSYLLLDGVLPDNAEMVKDLSEDHWTLAFVHLTFILVSSLTILNMLIGVLCEVVSTVSEVEREEMAAEHVKNHFLTVLLESDEDGNQVISRDEFEKMMVADETRIVLHNCGVDIIALVDLQDFIFRSTDQITFEDFFSLLLQLRSSNKCTVKDIVDTRNFIHIEVANLGDKIQKWLQHLGEHTSSECLEIKHTVRETSTKTD